MEYSSSFHKLWLAGGTRSQAPTVMASMTSIRTPDALIDCVHSNAKDMNNIMIGLILKRATTANGHPRLVVDRVLNTFAVVDAEPISGGGSRATVHFGVASIAPDYYLRQLTQGCA